MKFFVVFPFLAVSALAQLAATPAPPNELASLPPETVLATFDGKKLTAGELQKLFTVLPPQNQQAAMRDPKAFVQQYALMRKLAELAEQAKLDQESPAKEAIEFNRTYILSNAQMTKIAQDIDIPAAEYEKAYQANKEKYRQVRVKAIYIPFSATPVVGKKQMSEGDAKATAEKVAAQIRGGADFVKMVKQYSEDEVSKQKDGEMPLMRQSDNLPDAIRSVVFGLKAGEVSDPVRQPNGFYIFRAEDVSARPLAEVKGEIDAQLRNQRSRQAIESVIQGLNLTYEHSGFFNHGSAQPSAPPAAAKPPVPKK
jgi:parvulin-like peptidyl-prolyl isomerase